LEHFTANINRVFHLINRSYVDSTEDANDKFEIISFVRYLGVLDKMMQIIFIKLFKSETIYSFFDISHEKDDIFSFILDNYIMYTIHFNNIFFGLDNHLYEDAQKFQKLIQEIIDTHFSLEYKTRLLIKIISAKIHPTFILSRAVKQYNCCDLIVSIYEYFGQPTAFDFNYLDGKIVSYPRIILNSKLIIDPDVDPLDIVIQNLAATMLR